jgi:hypothetical protein
LALRDRNVALTCSLLDLISPTSLRQKYAQEANFVFLHALVNRMEQVVLMLMERSIPSDFNTPILLKNSNGSKKNANGFRYPSYFLLAVATGMYSVVNHMIKVGRFMLFLLGRR